MKIEVSLFIGGSVVKEVVVVEQFSQADQVAKQRYPFGRVVNRRVIMK